MEITSCAEPYDLSACGIAHGACIDADMLRGALRHRGWRNEGSGAAQVSADVRQAADIGVYDTCRHGWCILLRHGWDGGRVRRMILVAPALTGMGACTRLAAARRISQYIETPMTVAPMSIMKIASSSLFTLAPARAKNI